MAMFYFRTEAEAIEDELLCAAACEHIDCFEWRSQLTQSCPHCKESVAGSSCFIESGQLVHSACVLTD